MTLKTISDTAWLIAMGNANAVLLQDGGDLTLVDAGFPNKEAAVFDAIRKIGKRPSDLKHLVFTHSHPDHIGSAAAIVQATGARTYMHATDRVQAETGGPFRAMPAAPGILHKIMHRVVWKQDERMRPFRIDETVADGDLLPVGGGLRAVHAPGHDAGQLAFLRGGNDLLIVGDVFMNLFGLADPVGFEDEAEGRRSQRKLAALTFDKAVFGHGGPILANADKAFRRKMKVTASSPSVVPRERRAA